jgi:hypothetical protein
MLKDAAAKIVYQLPFIRRLKQRRDHLERVNAELESRLSRLLVFIASSYYAVSGSKLDELLAYFAVRKVVGFDKIRLGDAHDGGYIMLDDLSSVSQAYSLGIGGNVSWDLAMAQRGIAILQYDFSIKAPPANHALFKFHSTKIENIRDIGIQTESNLILKIDIEGSEWKFFCSASSDDLKSFNQILVEFHGFERYYEPEWQAYALGALAKLNQTHQIIHIHANNFTPPYQIGEMQVPWMIELTYVLKSKYQFTDTDESFPGPLDQPTIPGTTDIPLDPLLKHAEHLRTSRPVG